MASGFSDALFLNTREEVAECSTANLFWIKGQAICTPAADCGLLPGIVRAWLIRNFAVRQEHFDLADLLAADAVLVTNSLIGIRPVVLINDQPFPASSSPTMDSIIQAYEAEITQIR